MAARSSSSSAWQEVYEIVRLVPPGRVVSYGQVAALLARPLSARAVGWAMHDCPDDVPWHRVVNAKGRCSSDDVAGGSPGRQRGLLEAEGVVFRDNGTLPMERYRWDPQED